MSRHSIRVAACLAILAWAGCRIDPDKPLGPADSYMLFAPVAGKMDGALPVVRRLDIKDEAVQPLPWLLESTFAFEMVRTVYLAKQFVREATVDGQHFSTAARRNAAEPTCLVLGIERSPYGLGLALPKMFGGVQPHPGLLWIGLPAQLRTRTSDTILYATATGLESWRNLRHQQGGLLTDALIAGHGPVRCETLSPRLASGRSQFSGQVDRCAEVHFVRGLTGECRMGHLGVVLLNEKRHERAQPLYRVERVQIQPLVL